MTVKSLDERCAVIDDLMNRAYTRWQENKDWDMKRFRNSLNALERIAVYPGNLNYQVTNGGFSQWYDNGYYCVETWKSLVDLCETILNLNLNGVDNSSVSAVKNILVEFGNRVDDHEACGRSMWYDGEDVSETPCVNDLDDDFYQVNEKFLDAVEVYLRSLMSTTVKENTT